MMICELCGRPSECGHHLIFGFGMRQLADEDGLLMDLCNNCHTTAYRVADRIHDNPVAEKLSKMLGQERWEKNMVADGKTIEEARELFIKRYGRSWL